MKKLDKNRGTTYTCMMCGNKELVYEDDMPKKHKCKCGSQMIPVKKWK